MHHNIGTAYHTVAELTMAKEHLESAKNMLLPVQIEGIPTPEMTKVYTVLKFI